MRTMRNTFIFAVLLLVSVGAFAQNDDLVFNPDFGSIGGGGTGCATCVPSGGNSLMCMSVHSVCNWNCAWVTGYTSCVVHNAAIGPPYCEVSGSCSGYIDADFAAYHETSPLGKIGSDIETQIAGIDAFLRQSKVINDADLNDFIAVTDHALLDEPYAIATQKRLAAYRAEFSSLVALGDPLRELKPGGIPVIPRKPIKTPATKTAGLTGDGTTLR